MAFTPPPRLASTSDAGSFNPSPAAGDASDMNQPSQQPEPPQADPGAMEDAQNILMITAAARRIASKYPKAVPDVQVINDAVQKLQMKIMMDQPTAEVAAPPQ